MILKAQADLAVDTLLKNKVSQLYGIVTGEFAEKVKQQGFRQVDRQGDFELWAR